MGKNLLDRLEDSGAHEEDILFLAKLLNLDWKPKGPKHGRSVSQAPRRVSEEVPGPTPGNKLRHGNGYDCLGGL
jgi:hypothetical protein